MTRVRANTASVSRSRRRPAIADVVLDAEIALGPARIVAGRQHQTAKGIVVADDVAGGGGRQHAALPDQHPAEAVGSGDLDRPIWIATVSLK